MLSSILVIFRHKIPCWSTGTWRQKSIICHKNGNLEKHGPSWRLPCRWHGLNYFEYFLKLLSLGSSWCEALRTKWRKRRLWTSGLESVWPPYFSQRIETRVLLVSCSRGILVSGLQGKDSVPEGRDPGEVVLASLDLLEDSLEIVNCLSLIPHRAARSLWGKPVIRRYGLPVSISRSSSEARSASMSPAQLRFHPVALGRTSFNLSSFLTAFQIDEGSSAAPLSSFPG